MKKLLANLNLKFEYNTSSDDIANNFYSKCFANSKVYKRGVGYFTSGWLSINAKGLATFLNNGGKAYYLTSPILDENDLKAFNRIQHNE